MKTFVMSLVTAAFCTGAVAYAQTPTAGSVFVEHPWARATAVGARSAAVYLTVSNNGPSADRLLSASTPVADKIQFHQEVNDSGILRMRELPAIEVPPGGSRSFKPSDTHLMLTGFGQTIPLTLTFEKAGSVGITVPVARAGAMDDRDIHNHSRGAEATPVPTQATSADNSVSVSELASRTHFHGLAVDPNDTSRLYLATHHGLWIVSQDGRARRITDTANDYMGFTLHPTEGATLFVSGHPPSGGNLGFLMSRDGGKTWSKLSDGVGGPVDFHQMDVSKADPQVIYGVFRGLQRSADGGRTWGMVGPVPEGLMDFAASSRSVDTLYAATQQGLMRSTDRGLTWGPAHSLLRPATLVHTTRHGEIYAFVVGVGLLRAREDALAWSNVNHDFGDAYVVHLALDPIDTERLYAVTFDSKKQTSAIVASSDSGMNWHPLGSDAGHH